MLVNRNEVIDALEKLSPDLFHDDADAFHVIQQCVAVVEALPPADLTKDAQN